MKLIDLNTNVDSRGSLTSIEAISDIPFEIKRCYLLHHLNAPRGAHAHRDTEQILIAASGSFEVCLFDGDISKKFSLNSPNYGLLISPMTWIEILVFSPNAVAVVLASTHYNSERTIRSKGIFEKEIAHRKDVTL